MTGHPHHRGNHVVDMYIDVKRYNKRKQKYCPTRSMNDSPFSRNMHVESGPLAVLPRINHHIQIRKIPPSFFVMMRLIISSHHVMVVTSNLNLISFPLSLYRRTYVLLAILLFVIYIRRWLKGYNGLARSRAVLGDCHQRERQRGAHVSRFHI